MHIFMDFLVWINDHKSTPRTALWIPKSTRNSKSPTGTDSRFWYPNQRGEHPRGMSYGFSASPRSLKVLITIVRVGDSAEL